MKTKKDHSKIYSIIFIILCSIGCLIFSQYENKVYFYEYKNNYYFYSFLVVILSLFIIKLIEKHFNNNDSKIYSNKKALKPFFIEYMLLIICNYFEYNLCIFKKASEEYKFLIISLLIISILILSLFICYFFDIKIKDFNWKFSLKSLILIFSMYLVLRIFPLSIFNLYNPGNYHIFHMNLLSFLVEFLFHSFHPGIFEEVIYRGFLISGLKAYGIKDRNINIIQAILFGIMHFSLYLHLGVIGIIGVCYQMLCGYMFGKVYFKTKSLTPCILLHGLMDVQIW